MNDHEANDQKVNNIEVNDQGVNDHEGNDLEVEGIHVAETLNAEVSQIQKVNRGHSVLGINKVDQK